jgi:hypothetical protein
MLTHEERVKLIQEVSRFSVRIIERKTHAGTLIDRELPERGARAPRGYSQDESYGGAIQGTDLEDLISAWEE